MTKPIPFDDEALWFPAHTSAGDSFTRPVGVDGGPPADAQDDIGLPGRRPTSQRGGGSGNGKKGGGFGAAGWIGIALCGVALCGVAVVGARKEVASAVVEGWLRGQGVRSRVTFDALSLSHAEGSVLIGDAKQPEMRPEMSIEHFAADYRLSLFSGGQPLARIDRVRLTRPVVAFSIKDGKLHFGSLDRLVQNILSAPPSNTPPPRDIIIEDAQVRLDSDYGLLQGHGGISLHDGQLVLLDLTLPATRLTGKLGAGQVRQGRITARSVNTGVGGDQLHVKANLGGDNWTVRPGGNLVETIGADDERFFARNVALDVDAYLPYRHSKSMYEAFSGAVAATVALRADEIRGAGARATGFDTQLQFAGNLKTNEKGTAYSGRAEVVTRAATVTGADLTGDALTVSGKDLQLNTGFSSDTGLAFNLTGPLRGDAALLKQGDLLARAVRIDLGDFALASDRDGAKLSFNGRADLGQFRPMTGLALDQSTLSLRGEGEAAANAGPWNFRLTSDISAVRSSYTGLSAMARGRAADRAAAAAKTPAPGAPNPPPPDAIITLDRALERFALRVKGLSVDVSGDPSGAPPRLTVRAKSAVADLNGGGTATLTPHATKPLFATGQTGAFGLALSGPDLPQLALTIDGLASDPRGVAAGAFGLAAQFDFDPFAGATFDGEGRFVVTNGGGLIVTLSRPATFAVRSAELGDHLENLSATITQTGQTFLTYNSDAWRVSGAFGGLALAAPNESVKLADGNGPFEAYSLGDGLGFKAALSRATLTDGLPADQTRFTPLLLSGTINQDRRALTGRFFAATSAAKGPDGTPLRIAAINLDNNNLSGAGALSVSTLDLNFRADGLQPAQLTPMAAMIFAGGVNGGIDFKGAFNWDKTRTWSGGILKIGMRDFMGATQNLGPKGMDFIGPTGASEGLTGEIDFTSLAPLRSEPGQKIHLAKTQLGVPLTDLDLNVQFLGDQMRVESARVDSPGGVLRLEPTIVPFDGKTPVTGTLTFDGLDFGKVVAASDLAKSMTFEGRMSGRMPFRVEGGKIRLSDGAMSSDAPGHISIRRSAVTGIEATGSMTSDTPSPTAALAARNAEAAADPNFNPFQDLAYQAMEHIAFDKVDARLNSTDGGILDINFHIKGHFDPPQKQKANISLYDYITGKWMQKPIALPSNTPLELYLEVPLPLDKIIDAAVQYNSLTALKAKPE
ncbi:hypothetical protein AEAC466_12280 [Asticcacaulis sp. AC466]|uniref:intermembrane phospholipid transport protein YdbH family protein n=1 Tax=Asticcacaulis sp. AC466 TaxID=1282362 RepID=UPI0003C3D4F3|nr:YdbH domain-containing protein [Asticcacaulis sp. AC466]ESQ83446.1 hypothetical protein AEAC466_12280 [Asticcacaulis sp. AC466]